MIVSTKYAMSFITGRTMTKMKSRDFIDMVVAVSPHNYNAEDIDGLMIPLCMLFSPPWKLTSKRFRNTAKTSTSSTNLLLMASPMKPSMNLLITLKQNMVQQLIFNRFIRSKDHTIPLLNLPLPYNQEFLEVVIDPPSLPS